MDTSLNISRSDPLQRHAANINALVIDVGAGRLRLCSVEAADEAISLGARLAHLLLAAGRAES